MVFASGIFLFLFLPSTLIGYYLLRNRPIYWKNLFLLVMSLGFYLRDGWKELLLLLGSITANYIFALLLSKFGNRTRKLFFLCAVFYNIGMLFLFKYVTFLNHQLCRVFPVLDQSLNIALPLGISFYTFQALSYVIDVYRDKKLVEKNLFNLALYISFFPQLIAGPIVRWESIREDLHERVGGGIHQGIKRFVIGLGKKVIIANQMAVFADKAFELLHMESLTTGFAWLGAVAYTMQIYYDFSGYSDMAIGLGQIFGFRFPENFNYPYISRSITEFWRRWHISLSSWFRDYVYIPLGGNRRGRKKMYLNLLIVWGLTGIWHGANYTFWLWGILYFLLQAAEKWLSERKGNVHPQRQSLFMIMIQHVYTMLTVLFLWVLFRADTIQDAWNYLRHMMGAGDISVYADGVAGLFIKNSIGFLGIAALGCFPWSTALKKKMKMTDRFADCCSQIWTILVFLVACCITIDSNYNPFIYFNF